VCGSVLQCASIDLVAPSTHPSPLSDRGTHRRKPPVSVLQRGAVRCNMPLFKLLSPSIHPFPGPLCPWNTPTHATHSQHRSPHVQQQRRPAGAKNASQRLHCLCARYAERAAGTRLPSHCSNARAATIEATAHESAGRATGMPAMPKSVWSCSRLKCRCVYTYAYGCMGVCDWNVGHAVFDCNSIHSSQRREMGVLMELLDQ